MLKIAKKKRKRNFPRLKLVMCMLPFVGTPQKFETEFDLEQEKLKKDELID
jgi:hypothetical protein